MRSAARKAKSARARATIAARMILSQERRGRSFDDCFEMGDGDEVYRELMKKADASPELTHAIRTKGFSGWLEPEYRARYAPVATPSTAQDLYA